MLLSDLGIRVEKSGGGDGDVTAKRDVAAVKWDVAVVMET